MKHFRIWNRLAEEMIYPTRVDECTPGYMICTDGSVVSYSEDGDIWNHGKDDFVVMLYMEIPYEDDKKMCEGDFLNIEGNIWEIFIDYGREPYWPDCKWELRKPEAARKKNNQTFENIHPYRWTGEGEIVGNIFQHPELVNMTNEEWEARYYKSR